MSHLRFAGLSAREQERALREIISGSALLLWALETAGAMDLPD